MLETEKKLIQEKIAKSSFCSETNIPIAIKELIPFLIIAEDRRFYSHRGFDLTAIIRAALNRLRFGSREGASTIDQQLVRVLTGRYDRNYVRKMKEVLLAYWLDSHYKKDTIAATYLSLAYYGTEYIGIDAILSKFRLSIHSHILPKVGAQIVARLKYPEPKFEPAKTNKLKIIANRADYIINFYNKTTK